MKTESMDIRLADCMEVMAEFGDGHFDLAIVDPPYGIGINSSSRLGGYGGKGKTWDDEAPDTKYFAELLRVSKNQIVWGANHFIERLSINSPLCPLGLPDGLLDRLRCYL